jgi:N-[(2S)-2-amino-2-carboxyethyl]-L-glutamate dehydrogenase
MNGQFEASAPSRTPAHLGSISGGLLVLRGIDVASALDGCDNEILEIVKDTYKLHAIGGTVLPHSTLLSLPGGVNRIFALPGHLGGDSPLAGIKWIASVPGNVLEGLDRASALIILNDVSTGRAIALLEGSLISARRTAASALVAARLLQPNAEQMALVGCGLINFEVARLACETFSRLREVVVFDLNEQRATTFVLRLERMVERARIAKTVEEACSFCRLISIATTAAWPHLRDPHMFQAGAMILHISLRDLAPEIILSFDNIVDDGDHVCQADTSLHLCEKLTGNRQFIRCSLGDLLLDRAPSRRNLDTPTVFSPFGLGILDLAVARFVVNKAVRSGIATTISDFFPAPWRK